MPTIVTHAAVGLGLAGAFTSRPMPPFYWGLAAGLSMLPDLDVLAFRLGIPYGARFGHRGFSHSLCCAALIGLAVALATCSFFAVPWWQLWALFAGIMASHGLLDAFTNGGMGIALLAPFDAKRYFFPWRPLQVCMIGGSPLNPWNVRAFLSELFWIWVPLGVLAAGVLLSHAPPWGRASTRSPARGFFVGATAWHDGTMPPCPA
jgi:inner membrane protein